MDPEEHTIAWRSSTIGQAFGKQVFRHCKKCAECILQNQGQAEKRVWSLWFSRFTHGIYLYGLSGTNPSTIQQRKQVHLNCHWHVNRISPWQYQFPTRTQKQFAVHTGITFTVFLAVAAEYSQTMDPNLKTRKCNKSVKPSELSIYFLQCTRQNPMDD